LIRVVAHASAPFVRHVGQRFLKYLAFKNDANKVLLFVLTDLWSSRIKEIIRSTGRKGPITDEQVEVAVEDFEAAVRAFFFFFSALTNWCNLSSEP
jgi:hypothetical protein